MLEKEIEKYIDQLNTEKYSESIFIRHISEFVVVAKVWKEKHEMTDRIVSNFSPYNFFFIKNKQNKYIGAVLDMGNDLHWYILPHYRKKGYLTKSLKEAILPYLFYKGREFQRITIEKNENYLNSKSVATKVGFKALNDNETEFCLK